MNSHLFSQNKEKLVSDNFENEILESKYQFIFLFLKN